jgi:sulfate transport system permease protein
MTPHRRRRRALPGLPLTLSITTTGALLFVVTPLATILATATRLSNGSFAAVALNARALAAYRLTFGTALSASALATLSGLLLAWVITRYRFPGRRLLDALIDLPYALPTAVLGLALTAAYTTTSLLGAPLAALGLHVAFTPAGITLALTTLGIPLVVRALTPVLATRPFDAEEASAVLGATRWQTFIRVTLPTITPALLTGAALTFARGIGEYGSVVFIAGNMPFRTEVAPLLIMTRIEEFDDGAATAIATTLLAVSLTLLLVIARLERHAAIRAGLSPRTRQ